MTQWSQYGQRMTCATGILLMLVAGSCGPELPTTRRTLPSGRQIEVVWSGTLESAPSTWILHYRTRIPIRERAKLEAEVEAMWPEVRAEAEHAGATTARLWPDNFDRRLRFDGWRPVMLSHHSTSLSYEKDEHGQWVKAGGWMLPCPAN